MPDSVGFELAKNQSFEQACSEGFRMRSGDTPVDLSFPIDWNMDPFEAPNWQFNLHSFRFIDSALSEWLESGDSSYLRFCLDFFLDWYQWHVADGKNSDYGFFDMSCGIRAMRLSYLYRQLKLDKLDVSEAEFNKLQHLFDIHCARLSDKSYISRSNHAMSQLVGLYKLAEAREPDGENLKKFAMVTLDQRIQTWFTAEGIHKEHSPGYHFYMLRLLRTLPEEMVSTTTVSTLDKAEAIAADFVGLSGSVYDIGDSVGTDNGKERKENRANRPWETINHDRVYYSNWIKSGYAIIQSEKEDFVCYSQAFGHTHKHADDLAFILGDINGPLFIDGGKYVYDASELRKFIRSPRAHNTISVVDKLISRTDIEWPDGGSCLNAFQYHNGTFHIAGSVTRPGLFRHSRDFNYSPGVGLQIADTVDNTIGEELESILNIDGAATLTQVNANVYQLERLGTVMTIEGSGGGDILHYYGSNDQSNSQTVKQSNSQTVKQSNSQTVKQSNSQTVKQSNYMVGVQKSIVKLNHVTV